MRGSTAPSVRPSLSWSQFFFSRGHHTKSVELVDFTNVRILGLLDVVRTEAHRQLCRSHGGDIASGMETF